MNHCDNVLTPASHAHFPERSEADVADLLVARGQMCLLKGNLTQGVECFDSATRLHPTSAQLLYTQGLSLFEYGSKEGREKTLLLAGKKFKAALSLNPDYFEAWVAWGSALCLLGLSLHEHHYFQEASEKLHRAVFLSRSQGKESLGELYWDLGVVYAHLADHSEEPLDLHEALEAFQKALSYQNPFPADFWKDYGSACLHFAARINDIRFYVKAINHFKHAVSLEPTSCRGWTLYAEALEQLYAMTHDEDHFSQANECLTTATQLEPNNGTLWLHWAKFLITALRRQPDVKRLRMCIEKCHRVHAIDATEPQSQAIWAEALALLGDLTERVDLIYDAQNKICDAIDQNSDQPEIWYSYGMCLNACARYFNDLDYYYQAIEKFQAGLSIDRTCHAHWHAIGQIYLLLGQQEQESEALERSLRFFQRAIDLHPTSFYVCDQALALLKLGEMTQTQARYEEAIVHFERALGMQRNAIYLHPQWLFHYACALDALGDFHEEEFYYLRAIEIFSHVLMIDPDLHAVHHRLGLALSHLGELVHENDHFFRAIHHYRLSLKQDEENDTVIADWALVLINLAQRAQDTSEADQFYRDAEHKLLTAAKLGNLQCFYHLSCLHSLLGNQEQAMHLLKQADAHKALPPLEELLHDDWLDGLRATGDFREFLFQLEHRPNLQEER